MRNLAGERMLGMGNLFVKPYYILAHSIQMVSLGHSPTISISHPISSRSSHKSMILLYRTRGM